MNPIFGSKKHADEFDQLLSRSAATSLDEHSAARYEELLGLVATMRDVEAPAPRPAFSADLRSRLMLAAEAALTPDTAEQREARRVPTQVSRSPRERRLVAAVGGFAIVSATASMAVAAQSALPGDTLYPLKRAIENAQTGVQRDADGKGTTLLGNAAGRLDEVDALSRSGEDADAVATTLEDFVVQASEASDLLLGDFTSNGHASSIEELRSFTADSMGALTSLQNVIPDTARASLIAATQVINAIDVQAQSLCPACTDLPIIEAPVFATRTVDTLLDGALSPVLDTVLAPTGSSSPGDAKTKKQKSPGSSPGPAQAEGGSAPVAPTVPSTTPDEPRLPQSSGSDGSGKDGDKKGKGGLLDNLNVSGSDDPIGDLLTGTTEVVGDVLDSVTGLDGLSKK